MAITVYKQKKTIKKVGKKIRKFFLKKKIFWIFFSKLNQFTKLRPETESRNSGDHELWNHKMQESPVDGETVFLGHDKRFESANVKLRFGGFRRITEQCVVPRELRLE